MATSRAATGKKITAKTTSSTAAKKPLAKKAIADTPESKPKTTTKKVAVSSAEKAKVPKTVKTTATAKKSVTTKTTKIAVTTKSAATAKAVAPKKTVPSAKTAPKNTANKITVSPEERYQMIATGAYFLAEKRGFSGCYEMGDWITAEAEIDAKLNS